MDQLIYKNYNNHYINLKFIDKKYEDKFISTKNKLLNMTKLYIIISEYIILREDAKNNINIINKKYKGIYIIVSKSQFQKIVQKLYSDEFLYKAKFLLGTLHPLMHAKNYDLRIMACGIILFFFSISTFNHLLFHIVSHIIYLSHNSYKLFLISLQYNKKYNFNYHYKEIFIPYDELPIYTILIPLYKEEKKIKHLTMAMENLKYPKDKLDIKYIIEEDDILTHKQIQANLLPDFIEIITVPKSLPRTKPKALNYAFGYARGKYVAIFDAEDIPDKEQLLKAVYRFEALPDDYVCLQAKLDFYNYNENILTKLMSIEYNIWFGILLKSIMTLKMPVSLGGTSNHFKHSILKKIGLWDSYNLTEDAELGIRIYRHNYKVSLLDSITLEEAPISVKTWIFQRSRWICGFIQTFLISLISYRQSPINSKNRKFYFSIFLFIGFAIYNFISLPWIIASIFIFNGKIMLYIANINFIISYLYLIMSITMNPNKISFFQFIQFAIFIPFYFILHTIAGYFTLYQIIVCKAFQWNKTEHGISSIEPIIK